MKRQPEHMRLRTPTKVALILFYPTALLAALYAGVFLYGNSDHCRRTLGQLLTSTLPGSVDFTELRLAPELTAVSVYGAVFRPPPERDADQTAPVIEATAVRARLDPIPLLNGDIALSEARLRGARVIFAIDAKGTMPLVETFTHRQSRRPEPEGPSGGGPTVRLESILLEDTEFLLDFPDFSLLLEGLEIANCRVLVRPAGPLIEGDVSASSGRMVILPELFGLADPRSTTALRPYRAQRLRDPWGAVRSVPEVPEGEVGPLLLPLRQVAIDGYRLEGTSFGFRDIFMTVAGEELHLDGTMTPLDDKRRTIRIAAQGSLTLSPASPILAYFTQGGIGPLPGPDGQTEARGLLRARLDATLAAIGGEFHLELPGLDLFGLPIEGLRLDVETAPGGPFELAGDGLEVGLAGGKIQARGHFDPADGTYDLSLWLAALDTERFLTPFLGAEGASGLAGQLSSRPAAPNEAGNVGIRVSGDLDAKTFGDFLAARLEGTGDGAEPRDLAKVDIRGLEWLAQGPGAIPFETVRLGGTLRLGADGRLEVSGLRDRPTMTLNLDRDRVTAQGTIDLLTQTIDRLVLRGDVRSVRALLPEGTIDAEVGATLVLSGPFSSPSAQVRRVGLSDFSLGELVRIGRLELETDRFDVGWPPRVRRARVTAGEMEILGFSLDELAADLALDGRWLRIDPLTVDNGSRGQVTVSGGVRLFRPSGEVDPDPELDLAVDIANLDLAWLLPELPLAGRVNASDVRISGRPSSPEVEAHIEVSDAFVTNEWVESVAADVSYSRRGIEVSNLAVEAFGGRISGQLSLSPEGEPRRISLRAEGVRLENIWAVADTGLDLRGAVDLSLEFVPDHLVERDPRVAAAFPAEGFPDIQGSVIVRDMALGGRELGSVALTLDTYGAFVEAVGQVARDLDVRVQWPLRPDDSIGVRIGFDRVPLEMVVPGLAENESIDRGQLDGGRIDADIRLTDEGPDISANLSVDRIWLRAMGRDFATESPFLVVFRSAPDGSSSIVLHNFSFGSLARYEEIVEAEVGENEVGEPTRLEAPHYLRAHGEVVNLESLDLHVEGELPLSLASLFSSAVVDASGVADIQVDVGGTVADPLPEGRVAFSEGASLQVRGLPEPVRLSGGQIVVRPYWGEGPHEPQQISVAIPPDPDRRLDGNVFGGEFNVSGEVRLEAFSPVSLDVSLFGASLEYRVPGEMYAIVNQLDLRAVSTDLSDPESFQVSGNVDIQEARYFKDLSEAIIGQVGGAVRGLFSREVARYEDPIWVQVPLLETLRFEIKVLARDSVFVNNRVGEAEVDLELKVDLMLRGTLPAPRLDGTVEVVDGTVTFQNRDFEFRSCTLRFSPDTGEEGVPLPTIERCVAEATIARRQPPRSAGLGTETGDSPTTPVAAERLEPYIVRVTVDGRLPDDLTLEWTSVNYGLEERDVISLILTGKTTDELTAGSAAGQPGFELALSGVLGLVESQFRERLSVDTFNLTPTVEGNTMIEISDQVSTRLGYDVNAQVGGEQTQQGQVSFTLFDWLTLEVFERSDAENSVEAGGRLRFRFVLD